MVINKGVNVDQLGTQTGSIDTKGVFTKKKNKTNQVFIVIAVVLLLVIVAVVFWVISSLGASKAAVAGH
jgi:flagellar basal body-associated protein FliL